MRSRRIIRTITTLCWLGRGWRCWERSRRRLRPAVLSALRKPVVPELTGELPENDPHLIKARLLANAALNEYIGPEILASPTSGEWGALAQAEIYTSFGEFTRSVQSMKHSGFSFFALPLDQVPTVYWDLLFPKPYWEELVTYSQRNGLDPYLVASLIRQESEFNAGVVSHANAYGLMQLLPSVGKAAAHKQGLKSFSTAELLNPGVNLQLGTWNLKQVLDRFGGTPEYALAAYNAGDVPVRQWMSSGDYKDIAEFVESIPYTETRARVCASHSAQPGDLSCALSGSLIDSVVSGMRQGNAQLTGVESALFFAPGLVQVQPS